MNVQSICVVGCGYVGLPLAALLSNHFKVFGFDVNASKIDMLKQGEDPTGDVEGLKEANIEFTSDSSVIERSDFIIVCVPTPITRNKQPDLRMLKSASDIVGSNMKRGSTIVYESTVYPGVTEEVCLPIIERKSGLRLGKDFKLGYSPERVNPGDKKNTIDKIIKVISANDQEGLETIEKVYGKICKAGLHKASSIKVAEASKVIENTQRDINIALMNEFSLIFDKLNIDTKDVLEAAKTKWNFLNFHPGLVGGHCIGVDPYYLIYKAEEAGYRPTLITAARTINDDMYKHVAETIIRSLIAAGERVSESKVVILGLTYKENVNDIRNSRLKQLIAELVTYGIAVMAHDPLIDDDLTEKEFRVRNQRFEELCDASVVVIGSPHKEFFTGKYMAYLRRLGARNAHMIDIKGAFSNKDIPEGFIYHTL